MIRFSTITKFTVLYINVIATSLKLVFPNSLELEPQSMLANFITFSKEGIQLLGDHSIKFMYYTKYLYLFVLYFHFFPQTQTMGDATTQ